MVLERSKKTNMKSATDVDYSTAWLANAFKESQRSSNGHSN